MPRVDPGTSAVSKAGTAPQRAPERPVAYPQRRTNAGYSPVAYKGWYLSQGPHQGGAVDIGVGGRTGVNAIAVRGGVVIESRFATRADGSPSYGNTVVIRDENGYTYRYAHLAYRGVAVGDHVTSGAALGEVGQSGRATGIHLHFEVHGPNGESVNATPFLQGQSSDQKTSARYEDSGTQGGGTTEDPGFGGFGIAQALPQADSMNLVRKVRESLGEGNKAADVLDSVHQATERLKYHQEAARGI